MRVFAAGCFVFAGLLALVALFSAFDGFERGNSFLIGGAVILATFALLAAAQWLFNPRGTNALGLRSSEAHLRKLEAAGLVEATDFRATRAFGVEEFEDEGLHYYIELADGAVLFLTGQYLYDFEEITDDPDVNQPRRFPCTEFTVLRHKREGYVLDIRCKGRVLEPEVMAPPFGQDVYRKRGVPNDGDILRDATFDALKEARLRLT